LGKKIKLVDSAAEVAKNVKITLENDNLLSTANKKGKKEFLFLMLPRSLKNSAGCFWVKK